MNTKQAIKHMMSVNGFSRYRLSLALGKSHSYIGSLLKQGGGVGAPVLAEIANACGYKLVLVKLDGTDSIDLDSK